LERKTLLVVPEQSLKIREPPTKPVFFNPAASINRDVSVAITEAADGTEFCDGLAGVGARGIRVAREVHRAVNVALVDFNRQALALARKSARLNRVMTRCTFNAAETNSFLHSRFGRNEKYDFVDIDPFGTPAPYIQAALSAASDGSIVSFTATDSAVLCGVHRNVALRRYGAATLNNAFGHETAVRTLLGFCQREAGVLDVGVSPVAAHVTKHYVRVYLRASVGAAKAEGSTKWEGFVMECSHCGHTFASHEPLESCERCGEKTKRAGPMWTGPLVDESLVKDALAFADANGFVEASGILRSLIGVDGLPPFGYSMGRICSSIKVASVPPGRVLEALASSGFRVHSQPFEKSGFKTDASYAEVVAAVKEASH